MGEGRGQRELALREEPLIERQSDRERERIIFSSQSTAVLCQGRGACRQSSAPSRVTGCVVLTLDIVPTNTLRFEFFIPSVFKLDIVPTDTLPFCVPSVFTLDIEPTNTFRCFVLSMLTLDIVPTDNSLRSVCTEIGTH